MLTSNLTNQILDFSFVVYDRFWILLVFQFQEECNNVENNNTWNTFNRNGYNKRFSFLHIRIFLRFYLVRLFRCGNRECEMSQQPTYYQVVSKHILSKTLIKNMCC